MQGRGVPSVGRGGGDGEVTMRRMKSKKDQVFGEGVWAFCSYLFVPQRGRLTEETGITEARNRG